MSVSRCRSLTPFFVLLCRGGGAGIDKQLRGWRLVDTHDTPSGGASAGPGSGPGSGPGPGAVKAACTGGGEEGEEGDEDDGEEEEDEAEEGGEGAGRSGAGGGTAVPAGDGSTATATATAAKKKTKKKKKKKKGKGAGADGAPAAATWPLQLLPCWRVQHPAKVNVVAGFQEGPLDVFVADTTPHVTVYCGTVGF